MVTKSFPSNQLPLAGEVRLALGVSASIVTVTDESLVRSQVADPLLRVWAAPVGCDRL